MSKESVSLTLTHDEALVLFEFLARFDNTDRLEFAHVAEYLALARVSAHLDASMVEPFDPEYAQLLAGARARVAGDYEGEYPGPKVRAADV